MLSNNVYQHFRKDEGSFIDQVNEWIAIATEQYRPYLTDYLDPRQRYIVRSLLGTHRDIKYHECGGYVDAERQRVLLAPDYLTPTTGDFELQLIAVDYPVKFANLTHSQIMGTLFNMGVQPHVFGDIISDGTNWQFFTEKTMLNYIVDQIERMGRTKVRLQPVSLSQLLIPNDDWQNEGALVSSMRLDTIVSTVYHISRQRAKLLIDNEKVKLNWQVCDKPDAEVAISDVISVRGFGRIQLNDIEGQTRKAKYRLSLRVLRK
ncbi:MAG: RNA-binding protein [Candidatus Paralactobacillus gallistercoris]|uniref:RNA-binding protein n=1 Tax=Candidatus Paralactobacillus gallistercoris TaxID=2838724 RepID=A0A948TKQ4_9LACO|nr:RNA-binding protein [Candidatus Paralactobacillus gallistercoris]